MRTEVLEEVKKDIEKMLEAGQGSSSRVDMPSGFLALYLYRRRMTGGESAWISGTSTEPHQRMNTQCPLQKC
jgi:hypothetical protein